MRAARAPERRTNGSPPAGWSCLIEHVAVIGASRRHQRQCNRSYFVERLPSDDKTSMWRLVTGGIFRETTHAQYLTRNLLVHQSSALFHPPFPLRHSYGSAA